MTNVVTRHLKTRAYADQAFEYLTDYRNVPDWLFGVTRFTPVTAETRVKGAIYDAAVTFGIPLRSRVKVVELVEGAVFALDSIKGFKNTSRWQVEPTIDGGCQVTATVTYQMPGGPAGKAIEKVVEPLIGMAIEHSTKALQRQLDATAAGQTRQGMDHDLVHPRSERHLAHSPLHRGSLGA